MEGGSDKRMEQEVKVMTELKPCPKCGRKVKVWQQWHYGKLTWLEIHCACGQHMKSGKVYRGEPLPSREELIDRWNTQ